MIKTLGKSLMFLGTVGVLGSLDLTGFTTPLAHATDGRMAFDFETSAVLPKGVRNPRFKNLVMFMDEKFGGSGGTELLGGRLNKPISWRDVIEGQSDASEKATTQAKIQSLGFNLDDLAGDSSGVVNTYVNVKVPVFAVGVTDKLTTAVAIPIISAEVNADTGVIRSEQGQAFIKSLGQSDPDKQQEAAMKLNDAVNTKLKRLGYKPIASFNSTNIGDIRVVNKYRVVDQQEQAVTVRMDTVLPTGKPIDPDQVVNVPTGDGQWDVGATAVYDRFLDRGKLVRANVYGGYTVQLPSSVERRLPTSDKDILSADKETMERDLGDIVTAGSSLHYQFSFGLNASAGYAFQRVGKASYDGSGRFADFRYRLLEANTQQILHAAIFGLGFSSVEMFREHRFKVPFQLNMAYNMPLAGVNVVKNDFMQFELVMFF